MDERTTDIATPELTNIELVSQGWINKYVLTYRLPDGTDYTYEAVSRKDLEGFRASLMRNSKGEDPKPDAICIVPMTGDGAIVLIKEFRYPLNAWCIAFPAGLIDEGEDAIDAATRELQEETGLKVRSDVPDPLYVLPQSSFTSTGLTDENIQIVFAQVEKGYARSLERGELIETFTLNISDIPDFLETNRTLLGCRAQLILEILSKRPLLSN